MSPETESWRKHPLAAQGGDCRICNCRAGWRVRASLVRRRLSRVRAHRSLTAARNLMRKLLLVAAVFGTMTLAGVGCDKNKSDVDHKGDPMKMSTDDCAMCPGSQAADANGKCPKCGMKVKV